MNQPIFKNSNVVAEADFQNFLKEILAQGQTENLSRDKLKLEFRNEQLSFAVYFELTKFIWRWGVS